MQDWLSSTRALQISAYGRDPMALEGEERVEYVKTMLLALIAESVEALEETSWKPWAKSEFFNRDAFIGELVDIGHFLANCLTAAGCTDEEWAERYHDKQKKNAQRQEDGYDGVSTKCPRCRKALDDAATGCGQETFYLGDGSALEFCATEKIYYEVTIND